MSPLLTVTEAAEALSVHPATIRRMIARGEIKAKRVGRVWRVDPAELETSRLAVPGTPTVPVRVTTSAGFVARFRRDQRGSRAS